MKPGPSSLGGQPHQEQLLSLSIPASSGTSRQETRLDRSRHSILLIVYHLLKNGTRYHDLGADFFDRLEPERLTRYYIKRLQKLGHDVILEPQLAA